MKRVFASVILLIYLTVSSGFVVNMHYCMNKLNAIGWGEPDDDACGKCGMSKSKKCCKDEVVVIKMETLHRASPAIIADFHAPQEQIIETGFILSPFRNFTEQAPQHVNGPPLDEQDTYLEICVFRI